MAFAESAENYFARNYVTVYMEDAMLQLLRKKDSDGKLKPFHFLADYFKRVQSGSHVGLREYRFVSATPYNRKCFVKLFWESYAAISKEERLLKCTDYHSLLRLLCRDFPQEISEQVALVMFSDASPDNLMSFVDFLYTFQVCFYYIDFLEKCGREFCYISSASAMHVQSTSAIVVPTEDSVTETASYHQLDVDDKRNPLLDNINSQLFWVSVQPLVEQHSNSVLCTPSLEAIEAAILGQETVSYYNFVNALVRNESVSDEIGVLPRKRSFFISQ